MPEFALRSGICTLTWHDPRASNETRARTAARRPGSFTSTPTTSAPAARDDSRQVGARRPTASSRARARPRSPPARPRTAATARTSGGPRATSARARGHRPRASPSPPAVVQRRTPRSRRPHRTAARSRRHRPAQLPSTHGVTSREEAVTTREQPPDRPLAAVAHQLHTSLRIGPNRARPLSPKTASEQGKQATTGSRPPASRSMVRKGSTVRVRQRASQTALQSGFLLFGATPLTPSGPFRARRGQAWPLAGAAPSLARPRSGSRFLRPRYRGGTSRARASVATAREAVGEAFDADQPGPSWRAAEQLTRGHDGRVVAVGSSGQRAMATAAPDVLATRRQQSAAVVDLGHFALRRRRLGFAGSRLRRGSAAAATRSARRSGHGQRRPPPCRSRRGASP
jgi:hypothetical protein